MPKRPIEIVALVSAITGVVLLLLGAFVNSSLSTAGILFCGLGGSLIVLTASGRQQEEDKADQSAD